MSIIEGDSNEPKLPPLYKSLIFTGDPQIKTESLKIALLKELPHVHIFKTYVGRDIAPILLQKFLETPDHIPSLHSAFINDKTPDFIFLEVTSITILAKLFPNAIFETVQSPSFISNFCNIGRFSPQSFCGHLFARVNIPPYINEPAEILDINYSQKVVIAKLIPLVKTINVNNQVEYELRLFDPEQYVYSRTQPKPMRVQINYKGDGSSFVEGFYYNDCKYVDGFLIEEISINQIITWSNPLEEDDIHVFITPYELHSFDEEQKKREAEVSLEIDKHKEKKKILSQQFNFKIPKFDIDETTSSIERKVNKFKMSTSKEQNDNHPHISQSSSLSKINEYALHSSQNQDTTTTQPQQIMQIQTPIHSLQNKLNEQYTNILDAFPLIPPGLPSDNKLISMDIESLQYLIKQQKEKLRISKLRYENLYELLQQCPESNETVMSKTKRSFAELREKIKAESDVTAETVHHFLITINDLKAIIEDKSNGTPYEEIQKNLSIQKEKQQIYDKQKKSQIQKNEIRKEQTPLKKTEQNKQIGALILVNDNPNSNIEVGDFVAIKQAMDNIKGTAFSVQDYEIESQGGPKSETFLTILTSPFNIFLQKDNIQLLQSTSMSSYCPFIFDEYDIVQNNQYGTCIVTNCSYKSKKITLLSTDNRTHKVLYESIKPGKSDSSVYDISNQKILPGDSVLDTTNSNQKGTILATTQGKAFVLYDDNKIICTRGSNLSLYDQ